MERFVWRHFQDVLKMIGISFRISFIHMYVHKCVYIHNIQCYLTHILLRHLWGQESRSATSCSFLPARGGVLCPVAGQCWARWQGSAEPGGGAVLCPVAGQCHPRGAVGASRKGLPARWRSAACVTSRRSGYDRRRWHFPAAVSHAPAPLLEGFKRSERGWGFPPA